VEIKKMFEYLRRINFKITEPEDKKRLFRQLIMSFALDSENDETMDLWKDYYSIMDEQFDLYKARDTKKNNMRHIMGKNRDDKFINCVANLDRYIK
jgi:hypothetical protein